MNNSLSDLVIETAIEYPPWIRHSLFLWIECGYVFLIVWGYIILLANSDLQILFFYFSAIMSTWAQLIRWMVIAICNGHHRRNRRPEAILAAARPAEVGAAAEDGSVAGGGGVGADDPPPQVEEDGGGEINAGIELVWGSFTFRFFTLSGGEESDDPDALQRDRGRPERQIRQRTQKLKDVFQRYFQVSWFLFPSRASPVAPSQSPASQPFSLTPPESPPTAQCSICLDDVLLRLPLPLPPNKPQLPPLEETILPEDDSWIELANLSFTQCRHIFHHTCLSAWSQKSLTCPLCRTALLAYPIILDIRRSMSG